jgi:hypothetical protein
MKMPLMKTRGNFTREESIMVVAGELEGGNDSNNASEEKQKAARMILSTTIKGCTMLTPAPSPTTTGTIEIATPKIMEARASPKMIAQTATGHDASLSRVRAWVSQGAITGDTALAVKNTVIPSMPGMRDSIDISLPMEKARRRKAGMSMPKITTGPFK